MKNFPFTFTGVKEVRGQKPHFGDFFGHRIKILQYRSVMRRNIGILKQ